MCEIIKFLNSNSGAIMALTSFMMLVVSGFLAWNARRMRKNNEYNARRMRLSNDENAKRMRLISEENIKVGIWENRYKVYSGLMDWHDDMTELLAGIEDPSQTNYEDLSKCNFHELEKYIRKATLLFVGNDELSSFFHLYEDRVSDIFLKIHFKTKTPEFIYGEALEFAEWFLEKEDELFGMLDDYLRIV